MTQNVNKMFYILDVTEHPNYIAFDRNQFLNYRNYENIGGENQVIKKYINDHYSDKTIFLIHPNKKIVKYIIFSTDTDDTYVYKIIFLATDNSYSYEFKRIYKNTSFDNLMRRSAKADGTSYHYKSISETITEDKEKNNEELVF